MEANNTLKSNANDGFKLHMNKLLFSYTLSFELWLS